MMMMTMMTTMMMMMICDSTILGEEIKDQGHSDQNVEFLNQQHRVSHTAVSATELVYYSSIKFLICRFIVHSDDNNPMLSSLEKFGLALTSFSPHLIIVSGLQMLDSFPFKPGVQLFHCCMSRMPVVL